MSGKLELIPSDISDGNDEINFHKNAITGQINLHKFIDKDTEQYVYYSPSLDVTGYGEKEDLALEMVKFQINELFNLWIALAPKKRDIELQKLGLGIKISQKHL